MKCDGKIVVQAFVYDANEKSAKIIQLTGGLSRKKKRIFMRAAKAQLMQSREGPYRENCSIFSYHQQWAKVYFSILTFLLLQHWWQAEQSSSYLLLLIKAELEFSTFKCILHSDLSFCYFWKSINFQNHFCALIWSTFIQWLVYDRNRNFHRNRTETETYLPKPNRNISVFFLEFFVFKSRETIHLASPWNI